MLRQRLHYAWIILLLAIAAITAGTGIRIAFGSFVHPWEQEFGVSRGAVSVIATVSFMAYGLMQPVVGRWADQRGPGGVLAASLAVVAGGLLLSRFAASLWHLGLTFGLLASLGFAGVSNVPASVAVTRWFQDRRGLALALVTLASSVGQMTLTPASLYLNNAVGWRQTLLIYAAGLAVLAPLVYWLVKPSPASMGLLPYGATGEAPAPAAGAGGAGGGGWGGLGRVLATPDFWWLALPFFACGFTSTGLIDTHLVPFAEDHHLPRGATATAVALLAACNSAGVLAAGYLSDRIPRRYLLAFLYGMRALTLLFIMAFPGQGALLAFSVAYGLVDFSTVPPTSSLTAELFGDRSVGLVFGLISLSHQVGSAAGAFVPGLLHDLTGSYRLSFWLGAGVLAGAATLSLWVREARRPAARAAAAN